MQLSAARSLIPLFSAFMQYFIVLSLTGGVLWSTYAFTKVGISYTKGEADARAPALLAFTFSFAFSVLWFYLSLAENRISISSAFLPKLIFLFFVAQLAKGRLVGFPTVRFTKTQKMILYIVIDCMLMLISAFVLYTLKHNHANSPILDFSGYIWFVSYVLHDPTYFINLHISVLVSATIFSLVAFIFWFDKMEGRSTKTLTYDGVLFVSFVMYAVHDFVKMDYVAKDVFSLLTVSIVIATIDLTLVKEYRSIRRRAVGIDPNYKLVKKAINDLTEVADLKNSMRAKLIVGVLETNKETHDTIIHEKYSKKKRRVVEFFTEQMKEKSVCSIPA